MTEPDERNGFERRYKFVNYPRLRTPSDYSKGSLLHKKREADRMLEWQVRACVHAPQLFCTLFTSGPFFSYRFFLAVFFSSIASSTATIAAVSHAQGVVPSRDLISCLCTTCVLITTPPSPPPPPEYTHDPLTHPPRPAQRENTISNTFSRLFFFSHVSLI